MNQLLSIIRQSSMAQFACFVLPSYTLPTVYYVTSSQPAPPDPPQPQTLTQIPSFQELPHGPTPERLQLSKEELLAAGYQRKKRVWTAQEDQKLLQLVGARNISWRQMQEHMPHRTEKMCYSRYRRLLAEARQRWAPQEESRLKELVETRGESWKEFAPQFPNRTWKQLRDKYLNYLRPTINREEWSLEEDMKILALIGKHGTRWKAIQQQMGNRTDNQIKNRFYGRLKILLKKKARRRSKKAVG